jgi:hypothetical protein
LTGVGGAVRLHDFNEAKRDVEGEFEIASMSREGPLDPCLVAEKSGHRFPVRELTKTRILLS